MQIKTLTQFRDLEIECRLAEYGSHLIFLRGQAGSACVPDVDPTEVYWPGDGTGFDDITVTIADGCVWNATTSETWIVIFDGAGSGNGAFQITPDGFNPLPSPRVGTVTVDSADGSAGRRNRHAFCEEIINRCQMISGSLSSTLNRDHAYRFIKLGHMLERADMVTRVIDVGAGDILDREGAFAAVDPLLWGALLQAMSALGSYRRIIGPLVEKDAVVDFVFSEPTFPRSVHFCLREIHEELGPLNNNHPAVKVCGRARRRLRGFESEKFTRQELHDFIDNFQLVLNDLHLAIQATWFQPDTR